MDINKIFKNIRKLGLYNMIGGGDSYSLIIIILLLVIIVGGHHYISNTKSSGSTVSETPTSSLTTSSSTTSSPTTSSSTTSSPTNPVTLTDIQRRYINLKIGSSGINSNSIRLPGVLIQQHLVASVYSKNINSAPCPPTTTSQLHRMPNRMPNSNDYLYEWNCYHNCPSDLQFEAVGQPGEPQGAFCISRQKLL
jgi:hypothetical protein